MGANSNADRNTILERMKRRQRDIMKSIGKIKPPDKISRREKIKFVPFPNEPEFPVLPVVPDFVPEVSPDIVHPGPPPDVPVIPPL